jgi:RNA polymerase sigma factor (TIGR02999 family)
LVNEVYLRLIDRERVDWQDRAHFFAFAARTMRRVLVDHARGRKAAKRGSGEEPATLLDAPSSESGSDPVDVLALDLALEKLAALDEKQARIVELRYFAGLTVNETAEVTGIARASVTRCWALAKAFLYRELTRG